MIKAATASGKQIQDFARRINNLLDEKQTVSGDVASVYDEAKRAGVNTTALRKVIAKRRAKTPDPAIEAAMEAYEHALDEAASMVSNGSTSLRKAATASGFSKSAIQRRVSHRNENAVSGTDSRAAPRGCEEDDASVSPADSVPQHSLAPQMEGTGFPFVTPASTAGEEAGTTDIGNPDADKSACEIDLTPPARLIEKRREIEARRAGNG